jgi:branched-chain amino acid aminotransferase
VRTVPGDFPDGCGAAARGGLPLQPPPADFLIWVNGKLVPKSQAMVSVYDHGLLYGDGVFEGIRIYRGKIFKCKQHIERLYRCAEQIRMKIPVSMEEMEGDPARVHRGQRPQRGYIRLVVTRGFGTLGSTRAAAPSRASSASPTRSVSSPSRCYEQGCA